MAWFVVMASRGCQMPKFLDMTQWTMFFPLWGVLGCDLSVAVSGTVICNVHGSAHTAGLL